MWALVFTSRLLRSKFPFLEFLSSFENRTFRSIGSKKTRIIECHSSKILKSFKKWEFWAKLVFVRKWPKFQNTGTEWILLQCFQPSMENDPAPYSSSSFFLPLATDDVVLLSLPHIDECSDYTNPETISETRKEFWPLKKVFSIKPNLDRNFWCSLCTLSLFRRTKLRWLVNWANCWARGVQRSTDRLGLWSTHLAGFSWWFDSELHGKL